MEPEVAPPEIVPPPQSPPPRYIPFLNPPFIIIVLLLCILGLFSFIFIPQIFNVNLTAFKNVATTIPPLTPSPTVGTTISPSVSIKPTQKPTSAPTIKPSPAEVISDLLTCNSNLPAGDASLGPAIGSAPLLVALTGEGGAAAPLSFVGLQWDFDGNGTYDSSVINSSMATYTYTKNDTYQPKFRVQGSNGAWSHPCNYGQTITVGTANEYSNDTIMISNLSVNQTISKSNPQSDPTVKYPEPKRYAYRYAFTVSSKDKFTFPSITPSGNYDLSIYEPGANLDPGRSYRFHIVIDLSKPNGTYTGSGVVKYTTDNGTKNQTGPTINYSVTLTE